ncbi:MAG: ABC transporter substrate-binding protein, partial [Alphaproteobacteria bacterium]
MKHIFTSAAVRLFMLFTCLSFTTHMSFTAQGQAQAQAADFNATVEAARGQTVYFNAWGGDDKINDYIEW